ncbi:zinc finger protein 780B-like [Anoplophora glabripennis]|uniref:zinc finger protein 780B-like n=1 Tax=Anoplophora glabripennis TaxID=217634 RepID=UPI000C75663D|nr:zinc finger protein 780B-like [Anoplophora glabripennis]
MKEERSESMEISVGQNICRLCTHPMKSEVICVRQEEFEIIQKPTPEMNININKDAVVRNECFGSPCIHHSFLRNCLESSSATEGRVETSPSDLFVKTENLDKEFEINEMEKSIKTEFVNIKSEHAEMSDALPQSSNNGPYEKSDCRDIEQDGYRHDNRSVNKFNMNTKQEHNVPYEGDKCIYETKYNTLPPEDASQVSIYEYGDCSYKSKNNNSSQVQMHRCNDCDYEAKDKRTIKRHQLKHKDPSQIQMHKCSDCDYETNFRENIKQHQLKHKDPSQIQMHKCKDCDYETKYRMGIKLHQLKHKDPSQVQMYKCNVCNYQTKYKSAVKQHQLKHKDSSQVQTYKCNDCNYETKYKSHLKPHQLKHKDPSEVQIYRCKDCDYETRYRKNIKQHQLKHQDPSQVMFYVITSTSQFTVFKKIVAMNRLQETLCRLCRTNITDKSFEIIDNATRDILHVLLFKLKFDDENKEVICNGCTGKLNAALEFRSSCLNNDNTIIPHVDCKGMLELDIREVYVKEKGSELSDISDSQKICRLCLHPVESEFKYIHEEELEAIQKLTPEININIIKDPVVCKPCFDSLCTHNNFLKDCSEAEQKIRGIFDCPATKNPIDTSPSDLFIKTENLDNEFDINEMETTIKTEYVDIKTEDEEKSYPPLQSSYSEPFEKSDCADADAAVCKHENRSTNQYNMKIKLEGKVLYQCDKCIYETESERLFTRHCAKHENYSEVCKTKSCEYETGNKKLVQRHQFRHEGSPATCMHQSESRNYKTKYRSNLVKHQVKHKAQLYKCNSCDLKTEWRISFNSQGIKHKDSNKSDEYDSSQLLIYKCETCTDESKNEKFFIKYQLGPKAPLQVQMYTCNNCDYEAKCKSHIKHHHQRKHKDPLQVKVYKCKDCDFETKYKHTFKCHELKHKDLLQVQMYGCDNCDYKAIYKGYIKQHQLRHKDSSEVQMYKCDNCDYKSKYKVKSEFKYISEEEFEAIERLAPEMNINIIRDPVVCKLCFDSLCTHNTCLKDCSEAEQQIRGIFDSLATERTIDMSQFNLFIKTENPDNEFDINEMETTIKAEYVDIKTEDEESRDVPLQSSDNEPSEKSGCKDVEEDGCKHGNGSERDSEQELKVLYKCDKCIYETESETCFATHCVGHENDSVVYKCDSCPDVQM